MKGRDFIYYVEIISISVLSWMAGSLWVSVLDEGKQRWWKDSAKTKVCLAIVMTIAAIVVLWALFSRGAE